jgi:transglutaminase-like putative cysteine protease
MVRSVSCRLEADVDGHADVVLSVAVASGATVSDESLRVLLDGTVVAVHEVLDDHGTRLHRAEHLTRGHLEVEYRASVTGTAAPPSVNEVDVIRYARPSRYCESDRLAAFARGEFYGLTGLSLLESVSSWVGMRVAYIAGSSRSTDGAVATLLARQGVCRDFAHLVIGLLRGCDIPARLVSVYAPGLQPMDFHAIAEAFVDGQWLAVDATCLAPRSTMVRIATGRDAADTAFLTSAGDPVDLTALEVSAVTNEPLPDDDLTRPAQLG